MKKKLLNTKTIEPENILAYSVRFSPLRVKPSDYRVKAETTDKVVEDIIAYLNLQGYDVYAAETEDGSIESMSVATPDGKCVLSMENLNRIRFGKEQI